MTYTQAIALADRDINRELPKYHVKAATPDGRRATVTGPSGDVFTGATQSVVWWVKGACAMMAILASDPSADLPGWAQDHNNAVAADIHRECVNRSREIRD